MTKLETLNKAFPILLRYGGLVICFGFVPTVWLITKRLDPYIIGMGLTMIGFGEGKSAFEDFVQSRPPIPPQLPTPTPQEDTP